MYEILVAVVVVEYPCEVPIDEGDSDFSCLNFVQANIGRVHLFDFVAKIEKSRQKKYISCRSAVPINIVVNVATALSCCSSGVLPWRRSM